MLVGMPAYGSAREHLDDELNRVALILQRQIHLHWELGVLPRMKDDFSGTFVSGGEVSALFAGGNAPSTAGTAKLAELDAAITAYGEVIEERLATGRAERQMLPWDRFRSALRLSPTEEKALWVLTAVEISTRHRQLARYLSNDSTRVHADVGLVETCVYSEPETRELLIDEMGADASLFQMRLLEPVGGRRSAEEHPFLMRPLRVASRVIDLAHGKLTLDREVANHAELASASSGLAAGDWIGPEAIITELRGLLADAMKQPRPPTIVLVGPEGVGKRSVVARLTRELGRGVLLISTRTLPDDREALSRFGSAVVREALIFGALPVLLDVDRLGEPDQAAQLSVIDATLGRFPGPLAATMTARDARAPTMQRSAVRIDLPPPSETERIEIWRRCLDVVEGARPAPEISVERIASRYPITGGLIGRASGAAAALARARGDGLITEADAHAGLSGVLDRKMSAVATRITRRQSWEDLVVTQETLDGIKEFMSRLKHRRQVYEQWGFARKLAKGLGVSALFAGPPGTGKTMVAGLVALELGLELYQVDLSRVVSKYIGETEKHLAELFDAAESAHAVLLFDEADSLFGKRTTDVKSATDRYANLEVNFLLQRMEVFDGISILTTNLESSMDAAFKRRISFRLDFPFPEKEERAKLWASMIPKLTPVSDVGEEFVELAQYYEMSGGNIRNAVLRAAFLAAEDGEHLGADHLRRAADLEYISMGKVFSRKSM